MNNYKDNKRGGFYWKDNNPYLSVTQILSIISKPQLAYWMGKEVYYAMVKDPTLPEREALAKPYEASRKAMNEGQIVHSIVEAYKETGEIKVVPEIQPYANAFYQFLKDHKVELIEQEKTVFDDIERIGGTLDIYAQIGDKLMIIDIKTGKDIYPEVSLQNTAYAKMLRAEGKRVDEIACLLLEKGEDGKPTGKYKFATLTEDWEAFMAAKTLYVWNNTDKLIKTGWLV